jgi:two-component system NarL family sensor kinase
MRYLIPVMILCILLAGIAVPALGHTQKRTGPIRPEVQLAVRVAAMGLAGQFVHVSDRDEQIRLIRSFVGAVRFFPENSSYYYVYDTSGVCIAHAVQPELVGRQLIDYRDSKGLLVIQALIKKARDGGGFVEFRWERPDKPGTYEKLGYVEPIPGTDFLIGSGIYLPETQ